MEIGTSGLLFELIPFVLYLLSTKALEKSVA